MLALTFFFFNKKKYASHTTLYQRRHLAPSLASPNEPQMQRKQRIQPVGKSNNVATNDP